MQAEDRTRIEHTIDAGQAVLDFVAGRTRDDLDQDRMLLFAVVRATEILGEAAGKVSDEVRIGSLDIPWKAIVGTRDRLAGQATDFFDQRRRQAIAVLRETL
jgi:uncharacterized protein with HEPN domain